ncbi:MAG TPA: DUF362 domain-containing protein [Pirellulales bacterium]|nr:DUF362 domain-containing protein [Pirellulales bacterium]
MNEPLTLGTSEPLPDGRSATGRPAHAKGLVLGRRALLVGGGLVAAGLVARPFLRSLFRAGAPVFIARHQRYDGPLEQTIRDGLLATGLDPAALPGRRVLLKPNLVEPTRRAPHMTTHPSMIVAAAEVFRGWGATVTVGAAPGHVRDSEMALAESGLGEALESARLDFADLNYEETARVANGGRASNLAGFHFPRSIHLADLVVSMPKLKTHHWVGLTVSMKNLYGVLPGIKYGWPKNVLHHAGIPQTVFDINASLPKRLAIVDGIVGMEGDGPIMGSPKPLGLVIVGTNPTAVDATCARIMGLDPTRVGYLRLAADRLGPIADGAIIQHGERWQETASPFKILDRPHLQELRLDSGGVLTS